MLRLDLQKQIICFLYLTALAGIILQQAFVSILKMLKNGERYKNESCSLNTYADVCLFVVFAPKNL